MGILLDITIYSVIHHNPLHITQLANHTSVQLYIQTTLFTLMYITLYFIPINAVSMFSLPFF